MGRCSKRLEGTSVWYERIGRHTALATARKKNHTLVSERRVDEAWVVEYNPHCLEAMQSNMAIRLVMHTPNFVIDYITKGGRKSRSKSAAEEGVSDSVAVRKLQEIGGADARKIAIRADKMREICQSEAFFRIDKDLHMTESNVKVAWIDTSFPHKRGSTFDGAAEEEEEEEEEGGKVVLPNRPCRKAPDKRKNRINDKYQMR